MSLKLIKKKERYRCSERKSVFPFNTLAPPRTWRRRHEGYKMRANTYFRKHEAQTTSVLRRIKLYNRVPRNFSSPFFSFPFFFFPFYREIIKRAERVSPREVRASDSGFNNCSLQHVPLIGMIQSVSFGPN